MNLELHDATVVVTGGSSGIGLAAVRVFLEEGCKVAFCARDADRLHSVAGELSAEFGCERVMASAASVLDAAAMTAFAGDVHGRLGPAAVLVNNAGRGRVSTFADTDDDAWREELELKFFSQIHPLRAFEPQLRGHDRAAVVAVSSLLAYQPEPHMVCTSAARSGVQNLLKSLACELAPAIRVNSVVLGVIASGQWERRYRARTDPDESRSEWYARQARMRHIPLARFGEPSEVANAIVFLASPAAAYITGAQLEVSGGVSRFV